MNDTTEATNDPKRRPRRRATAEATGPHSAPANESDSLPPQASDIPPAKADNNTDSDGELLDEAVIAEQVDRIDRPLLDANLWHRIIWVRRNLPNVVKESRGGLQYAVITHEMINQFLRPLMNRAGLVDYISLRDSKTVDAGKTSGNQNNPVIRNEGLYDYTVVDADSGDSVSIIVEGHGEDAGDKAPGKAQTYAFKAGRTKVFSIAAGENEEDRLQNTRGRGEETITPLQYDELLMKAEDLFGAESDKALLALGKHGAFMLNGDLKSLPARLLPSAIKCLEQWAKQSPKQSADDVG